MRRTKNRQSDPEETIQYLVQRVKGTFLIEIPAHWKVTFSAVNPNAHQGGYRDGHCLRVYEGEKQRAVFGDVVGFRDMSIPYAVEIRKETGSSQWERDSNGSFKENIEVNVERRLEAPDGEVIEVEVDEPDWR
jgi:hypothetical protein